MVCLGIVALDAVVFRVSASRLDNEKLPNRLGKTTTNTLANFVLEQLATFLYSWNHLFRLLKFDTALLFVAIIALLTRFGVLFLNWYALVRSSSNAITTAMKCRHPSFNLFIDAFVVFVADILVALVATDLANPTKILAVSSKVLRCIGLFAVARSGALEHIHTGIDDGPLEFVLYNSTDLLINIRCLVDGTRHIFVELLDLVHIIGCLSSRPTKRSMCLRLRRKAPEQLVVALAIEPKVFSGGHSCGVL